MNTFRAFQFDPHTQSVAEVQFLSKLFDFLDAASEALGTRKFEVTGSSNFLAVLYIKGDCPDYKLYDQTISGPGIIYNMKLDIDTCADVREPLEEIEKNIQWPVASLVA